jgi:hypothetical protein
MGAFAVAIVAGTVVVVVHSFHSIKNRVASTQCGNNMVAISFAARQWADEHDGVFPDDLLSISNALHTPRILACPGKFAQSTEISWLTIAATPSYHLGFLGVHDGRTSNFVFLDYWAEENELHHHVFVSPADG